MLDTVMQLTQDAAQVMPVDLQEPSRELAGPGEDFDNAPVKAPGALSAKTQTLFSWIKWGGLTAGTFGLAICGIMMAIGRKNRSHMAAEGASGIPWVIGGISLLSIAGGLVTTLMQ